MIYRYAHPEYFRDWVQPNFERLNGPLVLWGAGKIGGAAAHCLKKRKVIYEAFCDIAEDKWGTQFCGHEVISPEMLKKRYPDAVVLISAVFHNSIYDMCRELGYREIYDCSSLFMEIDFSDYDFWASKEYEIRNIEQYLAAVLEQKTSCGRIDQIFLNITTRCSLRCRDCSLFIPYVSSPCDYPADEIMSDFSKALNVLGHVRVVNFYGGEPLLHPELASMVRGLKQNSRIDRISIITNGTILPDEDILQAIQEEKRFLVRISDYGRISVRLRELTDALDQYGIPYEVANYAYWDRPSTIAASSDSEEKLIRKFKLCTSCNNLFMINRKGYLCSTGSAVCNMGGFPDSASNYIDLQENEGFAEKLKRFVTRPGRGEYIDACRCCSGTHGVQFENKVSVAVQTKELMHFSFLPALDEGRT